MNNSNRTIYLPQAVIVELRAVKAQQEQYKAMLGDPDGPQGTDGVGL